MGEKRKGFIVFFDIAESLEAFNDEETGRIFRAMIAYAKNGEELPLPDREAIAFGFIKPQLERDGERYADICAKRKAAIEARWNNEKNTNDTNEYKSIQKIQMNTNDTKTNTKTKTDTNTDTKTSTNTNTNTNTESVLPHKPPKGAEPQKRFIAPTVEMVAEYCRERNNGVDAQRFVDYYSSNGWKVGGRGAMKDWKAAVRTWEGNGYGGGATKPASTDAAPVNKYAPKEGTIAAASFNHMLERSKQYAAEREATE